MKLEADRLARVLVVDDDEGVRTFLAESLERVGHEVVQAENGAVALELARREPFDVVLTDLKMPVLSGMDVVRALRVEQPDTEVVVLSAFGDVATAVEAMKLGAMDFLEKPLKGPANVRDLVARALGRKREIAPSERTAAPSPLDRSFVSRAASMVPVRDALAKVAKTSATVLLQGESGAGKEIAARAIHEASPRKGKPFVAINCAVLTENLLESELFGHEKGSFTGAQAMRRGRIELADGGTFFLDEVGELHPSLQAKLLRALEERAFERLGGSETVKVDVRWIAATHRDLRGMVREGKFRDDLYHRLAVFPVRLPPLRERREDIVPLAEALLAELAGSAGRSRTCALSPELQRLLTEAPWPGNVRELKNALERATILADGAPLALEHFDLAEGEAPPSQRGAVGGSLEDLEKRAIERALAAASGNRKAAAEQLGIGLRTLYEKLKRYGLR